MAAARRGGGDLITAGDHVRIGEAIDAIEQKTAGDIYCVLAHEASHYREVPLAWAAIVALVVPPLALAAGLNATALLRDIEGWSALPVAAMNHWLVTFSALQAALFALSALLVSVPAIRRLATPAFLKRHRVRSMARQHFISTGLHLAPHQPHVLIFLAIAERRVEILADAAIHKAAGERVWQDASAAVTTGMRAPDPTAGIIRAIEIAGAPLVEHFPATRQAQHRDGVAEL